MKRDVLEAGPRAVPRRTLRTLVALVMGVVLVSGAAAAVAAEPEPTTYQGHTYGTGTSSPPTADKPQSKLWYNDGAWWALMLDPADNKIHVYELLPNHTWRSTPAVVDTRPASTGDALWDGDTLYVASRRSSSALLVNRLSYNAATRTYTETPGFPVTVTPGGSESVALDKDSTGRLWVTYTRNSKVWVSHSTTDDATWVAPFSPPVPDTSVSRDDISSIIAFHGRIGVMWSNQLTNSFRFAVHVDGAPDDAWVEETPLEGTGLSDDHLNLKGVTTDSLGRIYAVVKTSKGDVASDLPTDPLIVVLVRSASGEWTNVVAGTVADNLTRPILMLDETNSAVYVFASAGRTVYYKRSPMSALAFGSGRGAPFISWPGVTIGNPTGSKHPVSAQTGLVVLASSAGTDDRYYHAELPLVDQEAPPDTTKPSAPGAPAVTSARATALTLSWAAATDDVGVTDYTVFRDGTAVGNSGGGTSFTDTGLVPETTYTYTVRARDLAGNTSDPSASGTGTTTALSEGALAFTAATAAGNDGGTTLTLETPAGTTSATTLLATVTVRGRPAITAPAGWQLVRSDDAGTTMRQAVYVRHATDAEPASYTWTLSSARSAAGSMLGYIGADATQPVSTSSGQANAASTTVSAPPVTTTADNSMVVALFGVGAASVVNPQADLRERAEAVSATASTRATSAAADRVQASAGASGPVSATIPKAFPSIGQVVVLRPGS